MNGNDRHPFETNLDPHPSNYIPLSPVSFLTRAASAFAHKVAVIDGARRYTYAELLERCVRLASALAQLGVGRLDTVAIIASNIPEMIEAHFAVPMLGAVLNPLNTRLDAANIAFSLMHGNAKVLIVDAEYAPLVRQALQQVDRKIAVIDIGSPDSTGRANRRVRLRGAPRLPVIPVSTGRALPTNGSRYACSILPGPPAIQKASSIVIAAPTFRRSATASASDSPSTAFTFGHCRCFIVPGGLIRGQLSPPAERKSVFVRSSLHRSSGLIAEHRVTHLCGAPIVLNMLAHAPIDQRVPFQHTVTVATGGAAPPSAVFRSMEALGFRVTHLYGATETYGPATSCVFQPEWNALPDDERFARMARQGVAYPMVEAVTVADPKTMVPVPRDGMTVGEIMVRSNTVMKGYLKNEAATTKTLVGNWCLSGDLAVWHPDGAIEIKDRSKDIIISGGENISSLEVEEVLTQHPAVMLAAVVARPDPKWGETPCAFLELKPGATQPDDKEVVAFCQARLARFKVPKVFVYGTLPKTSTGKIQKFALRDQAGAL